MELERILKEEGYSDKAIYYYLSREHVGEIKNPTISHAYTGHCGDTVEYFIRIDNDGIIKEVKFQAIGGVGLFAAASALPDIVIGDNIQHAESIQQFDIVSFLGKVPKEKIHCAKLAVTGFKQAIEKAKAQQQAAKVKD